MGLKDRIQSEMGVDTESILDEQFDRANGLFRIFQDGTIGLEDEYKDAPWKKQVLIYFTGRLYAFEGEMAESPSLPYEFFYRHIDKGKSTIRSYFTSLQDESILTKDDESGEWKIYTENLEEALDRIETDDE